MIRNTGLGQHCDHGCGPAHRSEARIEREEFLDDLIDRRVAFAVPSFSSIVKTTSIFPLPNRCSATVTFWWKTRSDASGTVEPSHSSGTEKSTMVSGLSYAPGSYAPGVKTSAFATHSAMYTLLSTPVAAVTVWPQEMVWCVKEEGDMSTRAEDGKTVYRAVQALTSFISLLCRAPV